jgi:AraC family transcriptional regulator
MTSPVANEDAFLISLQLRDWRKRVLWVDGKPMDADPLQAGTVSIFDLRRTWIGYRVCPFHQISFYLPRTALDRMAEMEGYPRIDHFANDPGKGMDDPILTTIGKTLRPAFQRPHEANRFFVDSVTTAAAAHVMSTYFARSRSASSAAGRLSKPHMQRSTEMIASSFGGDLSLTEIAQECGMSLSAFRRGFAESFGVTPYRWLTERRVEKAMTLLKTSTAPLETIARECGFANAPHLARVFLNVTGVMPESWRNVLRH